MPFLKSGTFDKFLVKKKLYIFYYYKAYYTIFYGTYCLQRCNPNISIYIKIRQTL